MKPPPATWKVPAEFVDNEALLRSMPEKAVVAQLGVWRGGQSERILKLCKPKQLVLVDQWKHYGRPYCRPPLPQDKWDAIAADVKRKFAPQVKSGQVRIIHDSFAAASKIVEDGSLDWLYFDGDVAYGHVLGTLLDWWPKLKPGGYWLGNEFAVRWTTQPKGLVQAVVRFLREEDTAEFVGLTRTDVVPVYCMRKGGLA